MSQNAAARAKDLRELRRTLSAAYPGTVLRIRPGQDLTPTGGSLGVLRDQAAARGVEMPLAVRPQTAAPCSFATARQLLRTLIRPALDRDPTLAARFGPELAVLLPARCGEPGVTQLSRIALGGTKRRLHRDSERHYRLVCAFASVAAAAAPTAIVISDAEYCDRYSLACLLHFLRTASRPPLLILETSSRDDRPVWAQLPARAEPRAWVDAESQQAEVLRRFLGATRAVTFELAGEPEHSARIGEPSSSACSPVEGEAAELLAAAREMQHGETAAAANRAVRLAQRAFGFSLNYELILLCCRIALACGMPKARTAALAFAGLTHAYLGRHDLAAEVFQAVHDAADTPEVRAQSAYYLGLVEAKRRDRVAQGRAWFERGLRELGDRAGTAAAIERGWLGNGLAFTLWRDGQIRPARTLIGAALADAKQRPGAQAANLRVNLANNLSVLLEQSGDAAAALEVWRTLEPWEGFVRGGTFAKSFRYRESWLLLAQGRTREAYAAALRSVEIARRHRDVFHTRLIGAACCYLAARHGDLDAAAYWAEEGIDLAHRSGHHNALAYAYGQAAHVRYQRGEAPIATNLLERGALIAARAEERRTAQFAAACRSGVSSSALKQIAAAVRDGAGPRGLGPDDALFGLVLERPKAKLTTPFPLAHLAGDDSFAPATHELALGTLRR